MASPLLVIILDGRERRKENTSMARYESRPKMHTMLVENYTSFVTIARPKALLSIKCEYVGPSTAVIKLHIFSVLGSFCAKYQEKCGKIHNKSVISGWKTQ